jgi:hypothetical protein
MASSDFSKNSATVTGDPSFDAVTPVDSLSNTYNNAYLA